MCLTKGLFISQKWELSPTNDPSVLQPQSVSGSFGGAEERVWDQIQRCDSLTLVIAYCRCVLLCYFRVRQSRCFCSLVSESGFPTLKPFAQKGMPFFVCTNTWESTHSVMNTTKRKQRNNKTWTFASKSIWFILHVAWRNISDQSRCKRVHD